jgi:energy-coupling factor transporter ATP-binding protein EcfA2
MPESPPKRPERVSWDELAETFYYEHRQGEHVALVGPTGSGKSTLAVQLVQLVAARPAKDGRPARVTVFATKPRDATIEALGWPRAKRWPPPYGQEHVVVWPPYGDPGTAARRQRAVFEPLMREIFKEGGQTVFIDEILDFEEPLPNGMGLRPLVVQYWTKARALDVTLIAGTQRPRNVARPMWSEPAWLFVFRLEDHDDLKRLGEIGGNTRGIKEIVSELDDHEFLLARRRGARRELVVSKVSE